MLSYDALTLVCITGLNDLSLSFLQFEERKVIVLRIGMTVMAQCVRHVSQALYVSFLDILISKYGPFDS